MMSRVVLHQLRINYKYQSMMLSVGVSWLKVQTGRQWHLAVINEMTFPTALAEILKNLFHFKVTSGIVGRGGAGGGRLVGTPGAQMQQNTHSRAHDLQWQQWTVVCRCKGWCQKTRGSLHPSPGCSDDTRLKTVHCCAFSWWMSTQVLKVHWKVFHTGEKSFSEKPNLNTVHGSYVPTKPNRVVCL